VNLIDEQHRPRPVLRGFIGIDHHCFDLLDAGEHRRKLDERRFRSGGDDFRQRGFPNAWRTPEDHGRGIVLFDLHAQRLSRCKQVLLSGELRKRVRTHALSQRRRRTLTCGLGAALRDRVAEEVHRIAG
jgi:hypothetical protein